jgi:hypothetical protein
MGFLAGQDGDSMMKRKVRLLHDKMLCPPFSLQMA